MLNIFSLEQLNQSLAIKLEQTAFSLKGETVQRWANGMFSNNIRKLQPNQGNYSAICDDRGRVQGFIYLYCLDKESFLCILDGISEEAFLKRFQMYIILDDIDFEETDLELFHLCGKQAIEILQSENIPLPEDGLLTEFSDGFIFRSQRFGVEGYDILHRNAGWLETQNATSLSTEETDAIRIFHGRAKWPQDGTDKSMIHELGLNEECCAFDKGCYVGQEIINRLDVKGLINKKIQRLELVEGLFIPDDNTVELQLDGKKIGRLSSFTSVKIDDNIQHFALGTIRKKAWEKGTLLQTKQGQVWKLS